MNELEQEQFDNVAYRMKEEGFDYCFKHYSNWKEIKDEKFHQLRLAYIKAQEELENYVLEKVRLI